MPDKTEAMNSFLEALGHMAHGRSRQECIANGICLQCGKPAQLFRDEISRREFRISGLCQECQDVAFAPEEEEEEEDGRGPSIQCAE